MNHRLISLDVFRGATIAAMILVNNPGSWSHLYSPLGHASWHGCTPTDLVFPFFLFIVGVAIALALPRLLEKGKTQGQIFRKISIRTVVLFGLGVFMAGFPYFGAAEGLSGGREVLYLTLMTLFVVGLLVMKGLEQKHLASPQTEKSARIVKWTLVLLTVGIIATGFGHFDVSRLRIPGVLQRIALVYFVCCLLFLKTNWKVQLYALGGILVGYWLLMGLPVPGIGPADLDVKDANIACWLDRVLLGNHRWSQALDWGDPEGLLSTLPAIGTGLIGMLCGQWLATDRPQADKVAWMMVAGCFSIVLGLFWGMGFPINKALWTSSYVLYTGGIALLGLACCYWIIDVKGYNQWTPPFMAYGANAITVFVLSGLIAKTVWMIKMPGADGKTISFKAWFMEHVFNGWLSPVNASLAGAVTTVLLFWLAAWVLYKRQIFIKV